MIVVSYRRADSAGYVRAVSERIAQRVGRDHVFLDVDAIEAGRDFRATLEAAIEGADALVLVVGPRWLEERQGGGSRLDEPHDVVRFEIEQALAKGIRIIPVLVDGATMPAAEALPVEIRALASRNAVTVSNERFDADVRRLLAALGSRGGGVLAARIGLAVAAALAAGVALLGTGWSGYIAALSAAAALVAALLWGVLRVSALRWVPGGAVLLPGLSVAVFALIILGGTTWRERQRAAPFSVTVRVTAMAPFAAGGPQGDVVLDVRGDARRRPLDANGEAVFAGLPGGVAVDSVQVSAEVAGYEPAVRRVMIPPDRRIEIRLLPRTHRTTVRGVVLDRAGAPVSGVTLDFAGLADAVSDALGRFEVVVPVAPGSPVMLRAIRDGVTGYHEQIMIPAQLPLEVRFDRGGGP